MSALEVLTEKHVAIYNTKFTHEDQARLTIDTAVAFAEWIGEEDYKLIASFGTKWIKYDDVYDCYCQMEPLTTLELLELYLKQDL